MRRIAAIIGLVGLAMPGLAAAQSNMGSSYAPSTTWPSVQPAPVFAPLQTYSPPPPSSSYDWQSGNMISTTPSYGGGATVNGYNTRSGATWNTQIQPNGSQSGTDSQGNFWTYNPSTGSYINSNGRSCIGTGAARVCN